MTAPATRHSPLGLLEVLHGALTAFGLRVTRTTISDDLFSHPQYPGPQAVGDVLGDWGVTARFARCAAPEGLERLPLPLLAQMRGPFGPWALVLGSGLDGVEILGPRGGSVELTREEFAQHFLGVLAVLSARRGARQAEEEDYAERRRSEIARLVGRRLRTPAALALGVLLAAIAGARLIDFPALLALLAVKAVGLLLSVRLMVETSSNHEGGERLCPGGGHVDCRRVLDSPAATLFGLIPVADLGMLYFAGTLLLLFFLSLSGELSGGVRLLGIAALLVAPYTLFSVVYQATVVRSWCVLCTMVQGLIWVEILLLWAGIPFPSSPASWEEWTLAAVSALAPLFLWLALAPAFERGVESEWRIGYRRLARRPEVAAGLLANALRLEPPDTDAELVVGPAEAPATLTVFLTPWCRACAAEYRGAKRIVERLGGEVAVRLRFVCPSTEDPGWGMAREAVAHCAAGRREEALRILDRWYSGDRRDPRSEPGSALLADDDYGRAERSLTVQMEWKRNHPSVGLPAVLLNGRLLPGMLEIEDLRYYLRDRLAGSRGVARDG